MKAYSDDGTVKYMGIVWIIEGVVEVEGECLYILSYKGVGLVVEESVLFTR